MSVDARRGWSRQQPITRATQRDEGQDHGWKERWPTLKRSRRRRRHRRLGRRIRLLPAAAGGPDVGATGANPILRVTLTRDHLSAISAITLDGRLFLQVRKDTYDGEAVVGFLRVLLRKIAGKIVLIWDGSPIHHGQAVKDFLRAGAAKRLHLEQLPGYAPDLNPDEGIWNYLKRVELGNVCCANLDQLHHALIRAKERLRHKKEIIKSCSRQCGYSV